MHEPLAVIALGSAAYLFIGSGAARMIAEHHPEPALAIEFSKHSLIVSGLSGLIGSASLLLNLL